MKVTETLSCSKQAFFDVLYDSIAWDVRESTGSDVSFEELQNGFSYVKTMKSALGSEQKTKISIVEFAQNNRYVARYVTDRGTDEVSYEIEDLGDGAIRVTYRERFEGATRWMTLNYKLLGCIAQLGGKRRIRQMLQAMANVRASASS